MNETLFGPQPYYLTTDDVYTHPDMFKRLGLEFDLDVCSPPGGLPWVPAKQHYSIQDDGLTSPWHGLVWMNPPYSKPGPWVKKWLEHGNGVMLAPFAKSNWFRDVWAQADAITVPTKPNGSIYIDWIKGGKRDYGIFLPVFLAAMGESAIAALHNFEAVR